MIKFLTLSILIYSIISIIGIVWFMYRTSDKLKTDKQLFVKILDKLLFPPIFPLLFLVGIYIRKRKSSNDK